jgi:hypothetical protein
MLFSAICYFTIISLVISSGPKMLRCLIRSLRADKLYATINTTYIERRVFLMTASIRLRFHIIN